MSQGFIVRVQNFSDHSKGGASYVMEGKGFGGINSKYRLGKIAREDAYVFSSRRTANRYAQELAGRVVTV